MNFTPIFVDKRETDISDNWFTSKTSFDNTTTNTITDKNTKITETTTVSDTSADEPATTNMRNNTNDSQNKKVKSGDIFAISMSVTFSIFVLIIIIAVILIRIRRKDSIVVPVGSKVAKKSDNVKPKE